MAHPPPSYSPYLGETPEAGPSSPFTAARRLSRPYSPVPRSPSSMTGDGRRPSGSLQTPSSPLRRVASPFEGGPADENNPGRRPSCESFRTVGRSSFSGPPSPNRAAPQTASASSSFAGPSSPASTASLPSPPPPRPGPLKRPIRGLSLNIPPGPLAYGGLTQVVSSGSSDGGMLQDKASAPPVTALEGPASIVEAASWGPSGSPRRSSMTSVHVNLSPRSSPRKTPSSATLPLKAGLSKKRPARLNLAPSPSTPNFVAQQGDIEGGAEEESETRDGVEDELPRQAETGRGDSLRVPGPANPPRHQYSSTVDEVAARRETSPSSAKRMGVELSPIQEREKQNLRNTLTGRPRRRPSMPFSNVRSERTVSAKQLSQPVSKKSLPESWQDPSEHSLSGEGSSLQHARSVYAAGPIEVLPGLFLGDEHNAKDDDLLAEYNITTILDVAKETLSPLPSIASTASRGPRTVGPDRWYSVLPALPETRGRSPGARAFSMLPVLEHETYLTPSASRFSGGLGSKDNTPSAMNFPADAHQTPLQRSPSVVPLQQPPPPSIMEHGPSPPSHLLRNSLSTPNLQLEFKLDGSSDVEGDQNGAPSSSVGTSTDEESEARASDRGAFSIASDASSAVTEATSPGTSSEADEERGSKERHGSGIGDSRSPIERLMPPAVELPQDALISVIPPSPISGRTEAINYVKLPWTHEQTELALPGGGFVQGCAIIAHCLGIDYFGRPLIDPDSGQSVKRGNVLVHCQCGVSRSATLTIAFVMQCAALNYPFDKTRSLTGMHDCYNLVKDLSSSVSPNISLIYQLVEWERHLSSEAARLREALNASTQEQLVESGLLHATRAASTESLQGAGGDPSTSTSPSDGSSKVTPAVQVGWSNDAMGEEEWTRMRREEEQKEEVERSERKRLVEEEAKRQAEERRRREERGGSSVASPAGRDASMGRDRSFSGGLSARRRKQAPSLQLGSGATRSSGGSAGVPTLTVTSSSSGGGGGGGGGASSTSSSSSDLDAPLRSARLDGAFPSGLAAASESANSVPRSRSGSGRGGAPPSLARLLEKTSIAEENEQPESPLRTATASSGLFPAHGSDTPKVAESVSGLSDTLATSEPKDSVATEQAGSTSAGESTPKFLSAAGASARPYSFDALPSEKASASTGDEESEKQKLRPSFPGSWTMRQSLSHGALPPSLLLSNAGTTAIDGASHVGPAAAASSSIVPPPTFRPRVNFGLGKGGMSSAERKMQHRRTFSSEVKWDAILAKATATSSATIATVAPAAAAGVVTEEQDKSGVADRQNESGRDGKTLQEGTGAIAAAAAAGVQTQRPGLLRQVSEGNNVPRRGLEGRPA
ncbi:hypothetical protein BCV69DRAFT_200910 [Microstroma glucosiphilum]|uniref:protein-tyrosine-phosphatase n=1 Tax=Pseudomicrostroma glucosiphilum TaxID=1684307 RepID=A0A316U6K0_9BASI|nr:hypothetical protein BCV69DRAFT_200910 [Pseudomicrostroma glucosiphilum]PWN20840.1 hypothetical protein BCV69DRAFT_200910 [Pseudomicrostroma glucosiphilum]